MKYRSEIDGLRAIAVIPVVFFHAGFGAFSGGYVGVDIFFAISGYLITTIIITELDSGTFSLASFYTRRARRILPALLFVVIVSCIFSSYYYDPQEFKYFIDNVFGVLTFSSNIFLWLQSGYFDIASDTKPLLHTWSLSVEEQYYIIFPILCVVSWKFGRCVFLGMVLLGFIVSILLGEWGSIHKPTAAFYLLPTRAWEILFGALAGIALYRDVIGSRYRWLCETASITGIVMISCAITLFDQNTHVSGVYTALPVGGAVLIICFAQTGTFVARFLSWRPLVWIGLISYSLYLWHQPLLAFSYHQLKFQDSTWQRVALCFGLLPVAYFTWRYIEKPCREHNSLLMFFRPKSTLIVLGALSFVAWFGFDLYLAGKYRPAVIPVAKQFAAGGDYVNGRWSDFILKEFDQVDNRKKIILIGDSFAQDLLNAVQETDLKKHYNLSVYHISARCGNIWTDANLNPFISAVDKEMCSRHPRYRDPILKDRLESADEVWLASSWKEWQVPYVRETVNRLQDVKAIKVLLFGIKSFGHGISFDRYLFEQESGNVNYLIEVEDRVRSLNQDLENQVPEGSFVDVQRLLCGLAATCRNTDIEGLLLSYDGGHLTRAGAIFYGNQLHKALDDDEGLYQLKG